MGCLNTKPGQEIMGVNDVMDSKPTRLRISATNPVRQAVIGECELTGAERASGDVDPEWSRRSNELKQLVTIGNPDDKHMESLILVLAKLSKSSIEKRQYFCDVDVIQSLLQALQHGPLPVAKASAHALKLLTFCRPNHLIFLQCEDAVPVLIKSLLYEHYEVMVSCLSALCNLSASLACVWRFATDRVLLGAIERMLTQKVLHSDPQACASQLLLNLTFASSYAISRSENSGMLTMHGQFGDSTLTRDTDGKQMTSRAWSSNQGSTYETHSSSIIMGLQGVDTSALMAVALRVLLKATQLDAESRENCIEVILALLQQQKQCGLRDSKVSRVFIQDKGLEVVIKESIREQALASTQVLVCQILHMFTNSYFEDICKAGFNVMMGHLLSLKTKRGAEERQVDVDVQHAALMLALRVHKLGNHRQQLALASQTAGHLPACIAASSVAVQLSACRLLRSLAKSSVTRRVLQAESGIACKLVELNAKQHPLTTAPAIECIGLLCDLSRANADAVVRANGLQAMLHTLKVDCPQAQRHALVSLHKVLVSADKQHLIPRLQDGPMISLIVFVLRHTAHSGINDQTQWISWCCRVLHAAALVDSSCASKVVSSLSKRQDVLHLLGLHQSANHLQEEVLGSLEIGKNVCSDDFIAKVADLQQLEEAIACELDHGHHHLLSTNTSSLHCTTDTITASELTDAVGCGSSTPYGTVPPLLQPAPPKDLVPKAHPPPYLDLTQKKRITLPDNKVSSTTVQG